jgi:hypothetical protein
MDSKEIIFEIIDRGNTNQNTTGSVIDLIPLNDSIQIRLSGDSPTEGDTDIVDDIFFLNNEGVNITERLADTKKIKNVTDIGVVDSDCDTALEIRVGILDVEECSTPTEDFVKPNLFDGLYYNRTYLNGNKYYDIPAISSECCSKLEGTYDGKAESFLSEEGYTKCRYRDALTCDSFNGSTFKKWGNRVPFFEINNEETPFVPSTECCDNIQWEYNGKKYDLVPFTSSYTGKISCRIPDICVRYVANNIANNEAEKYSSQGYYIFTKVKADSGRNTSINPTLDDLKVPSAECCNNVQGLTSKIVNGRIFCVKSNTAPIVEAGDNYNFKLTNSNRTFSQRTITASVSDDIGNPNVQWTKVSGPDATIVSPNSVITEIKNLNTKGVYVFKLTATDDEGLSSYDTMSINITQEITSNPPSFELLSTCMIHKNIAKKNTLASNNIFTNVSNTKQKAYTELLTKGFVVKLTFKVTNLVNTTNIINVTKDFEFNFNPTYFSILPSNGVWTYISDIWRVDPCFASNPSRYSNRADSFYGKSYRLEEIRVDSGDTFDVYFMYYPTMPSSSGGKFKIDNITASEYVNIVNNNDSGFDLVFDTNNSLGSYSYSTKYSFESLVNDGHIGVNTSICSGYKNDKLHFRQGCGGFGM